MMNIIWKRVMPIETKKVVNQDSTHAPGTYI